MKSGLAALLIIIAAGLIGLSQSVFTVDEREQALVLQLGQPVGDIKEPGLHFKIPVVQDVRRFDERILSIDPAPTQMVVSSSQSEEEQVIPEPIENDVPGRIEVVSGEPIIVDTFARYRIADPLQFMKTLGTIFAASDRLEQIINDTTRNVLGNSTLRELLSPERTAIMHQIRARAEEKIGEDKLGIELVDIRIVRADLTSALRQSTVKRMISELRKRATETRAQGEEKALEIRSTANKEREILLAEAQREAQIIRGEGDEIAIKTYADAFNKDKEFYGFFRSMEAYRKTLATPDTRLILSPESEFFKHFKGNSE